MLLSCFILNHSFLSRPEQPFSRLQPVSPIEKLRYDPGNTNLRLANAVNINKMASADDPLVIRISRSILNINTNEQLPELRFQDLTPEIIISCVEEHCGINLDGVIIPNNSYVNKVYGLQGEDMMCWYSTEGTRVLAGLQVFLPKAFILLPA